MDIIFENKTDATKEVLTEFSQNTYKVYSQKYRIFVLLAAIVSAFWAVAEIAAQSYWSSAIMFLAAALFLFLFFKGYILKMNQNRKNLQALYGQQPQFTFIFFEDGFECVSAKSNLKINYSQITKLIETKNLYLLMIGKQGLMLNKSGFTVGSADAFKSFIMGKCKIFFNQKKNPHF